MKSGVYRARRRSRISPVCAAEVARLQKTAAALDLAETRALPGLASASQDRLAAINRILFRTERSLTMDPGLPGRPWYRHRIYAPGRYTGYDAKTLPGIREAVEAGKPDEAREQAGQVVQVLRALNDRVDRGCETVKTAMI